MSKRRVKYNFKYALLSLILLLETFVFIYIYFFGQNGLMYARSLQEENFQLYSKVLLLKNEIDTIKNEIKDFTQDSFYKEKYAREILQLAKKDDKIYYLI